MTSKGKQPQHNRGKQQKLKLHPEAHRAYKIIKSHDAVTKMINQPEALENGDFRVRFEIEVPLPSKARKAGVTKTSVREREPVIFHFPMSYPYKAPKIFLRSDFNRNLPHINPIDIHYKELVSPCVYYGSLDELMHMSGDGLCEIINHLSEWLGKAAIDDLIDPSQGWEPIRRDDTSGWVVYDLAEIRSLIIDSANVLVFRCLYHKDPLIEKDYFVWGIDINDSKNITPFLIKESQKRINTEFGPIHYSLVFISWANRFDGNQEKHMDRYLPETVVNFQQLMKRAEEYGCDKPLKDLFIQVGWAYNDPFLRQCLNLEFHYTTCSHLVNSNNEV